MFDVNQQWLQSLKAGDEVAVYHSGFSGFYGRYEFSRVTKVSAKFLTVGATRYRREDGRKAGNDRYRSCVKEPTPELKAEEAKKQRYRILIRALNETTWDCLPLPILEGVYSLLPQKDQQS